jgi:predicted dinucleotide-binding enzyme
MSNVTNVILSFSVLEADEIVLQKVNEFDFPHGSGFINANTEGTCGGSKWLERPTFVGAFNHLDLEALKQHLRRVDWEEPAFVQLIVCGQDDDEYRIEPLFGLGL